MRVRVRRAAGLGRVCGGGGALRAAGGIGSEPNLLAGTRLKMEQVWSEEPRVRAALVLHAGSDCAHGRATPSDRPGRGGTIGPAVSADKGGGSAPSPRWPRRARRTRCVGCAGVKPTACAPQLGAQSPTPRRSAMTMASRRSDAVCCMFSDAPAASGKV